MTATQNTETVQTLAVLDPNRAQGAWIEVHRDGCSHLKRGRKGEGAWTLEARSLEEAALDIAGDFIREDSMTVEGAVDQITWAPCVKLPRALGIPATTPRKGRKLTAVPDPTPAVEEPTPKRKSLPNAERKSEATHPAGGSAVSHGKCPQCGSRKGRVCTGKTGQPTNFVHAPRMRAWEAAGAPELPMPNPARKTAEGWVVVK